jgi:hypothetical protein
MKTTILLLSLLLFALYSVNAQIDPSIPTPKDLADLKDNIKVVTKERLSDGTIVIRYIDKQGRTIQRRTHPSKPNEKQEWDEANPPQKATEPSQQGIGAARTSGPGEVKAATDAPQDTTIKGSLGYPPPSALPKSDPPSSPMDDVKKGAEGVIPKPSQPATPTSVLKDAAKAAEEILDDILDALSNLDILSTTGTGETTGNIANIEVKNTGETPITVIPQTAYIPSSGQYQPYISFIPGITIPPGVTTTIPVSGYCVDVHKPPVSNGDPMPPLTSWIPVGNPNTPIPEGSAQIIPVVPVMPFEPVDIPGILNSPEYKFIPHVPADGPIITWPGTDVPVGGTFVAGETPQHFAPVIVKAYEEITSAVKTIQNNDEYSTPFSPDSVKEYEALTQNVIWIFAAELSGGEYKKDDFATNLYKQFESTTGRTVASLPAEQKEKIDSGVDDFWNVFTAVGVEAKVISNPETTEPPPPELIKDGECILKEEIKDTKQMLDYAIAETGTKGKNEKVKEAFKKAIEEAAGLMSSSTGSDTVDVGFCTPQMPASAWSLYFPHVVAGQANASAFAVDMKNPLESAWTTDPLQTKADGNRVVILTHVMDDDCKSTLVGINFAKVRAASGLKASLGNIEALQVINFVGEIAIDIVIQRGKGTFTKLSKYLAEKTKDMAKDAAKDFIKSELEKFNNEWKGKTDEEAEKSMDELLKEIKEGDDGGDPVAEGEEFLNDWLAEMLIEGDGIDPEEKIEGDLLDKIDSPIDWSPIQTNTYAIGEGSLDVYVDGDHGVAKAASGVRYKREGLESAEEAEKGGGVVCDAGLASHATSGSITLKTFGKTGSWAGATGEGIISTGHGIAISTLESFNGMYAIAICECPDGTSYETFSSITAYSVEDNMTGIWVSMFDRLMNDVADQLDKDIQNAGNASKSLPKGTADKVQKGLENAARQAAQSILPCGVAE